MKPVHGQRVLITGASGGLGRALALQFAKRGARLVLVARREAELAESAAQVRQAKAEVHTSQGDITLPECRAKILSEAESAFGGLDLLVNNAGISAHGRMHESSPDRLRHIMEVNLFAAAELIRESVPLLRTGQSPAVVNIGSILGWRGIPHNAEYCASKFALRGLSEAIRPELKKLGIHLLHASPGTINTPFFDHLIDKQGELPWGKRQGVEPEYVAKRVVRALEQRRNEVTMGWQAWAFIRASRMAPWLMDKLLRSYG